MAQTGLERLIYTAVNATQIISTQSTRHFITGRRPRPPYQPPNKSFKGDLCPQLENPVQTGSQLLDAQCFSGLLKKDMRDQQNAKPHLFTGPLPGSSILRASDDVLVSSPELCFFQMASQLPLVKLIELGYELCGSYSLINSDGVGPGQAAGQAAGQTAGQAASQAATGQAATGQGFLQRPPLTSAKRLDVFALRMAEVLQTPTVSCAGSCLSGLATVCDLNNGIKTSILSMIKSTLPYQHLKESAPMRTTVFLDDELFAKARALSGLTKTSQVIDAALNEYVKRQSQLRLAALKGSLANTDLTVPPRRRASRQTP